MRDIKTVTSKECIHCPTKEDATAIFKLMIAAGDIKWYAGDQLEERNTNWDSYDVETCYQIEHNRVSYGSRGFHNDYGYTIIPASKFLSTTGEEIPDKWKIYVADKEQAFVVGKWFDENHGCKDNKFYQTNLTIGWYDNAHNPGNVLHNNPEGVKTISFEQFKKFILKQEAMSTQKITREGLKEIHAIACTEWQGKIAKFALRTPLENTVEFTNEEVETMFKAATSTQLPVLKKYFKQEEFNASMLEAGEIMLSNDYGYCIRTTKDALVWFQTKLPAREGQIVDDLCRYKGKKIPSGTSITITAK